MQQMGEIWVIPKQNLRRLLRLSIMQVYVHFILMPGGGQKEILNWVIIIPW